MTRVFCLLLVLLILFPSGCNRNDQPTREIRLFAAASTGPAVEDLASWFNKQYSIKLVTQIGASSTLVQQIVNGASCDLVLLADDEWMNVLEEKNLIDKGSRLPLLSNRLTIIAPRGRSFSWNPSSDLRFDQSFAGRLIIADPSHVPAGRYAKAALTTLGAWDAFSNRLLYAPDARAALVWVERGEASAGIVYRSDATASDKVDIVADLPERLHPTIQYPLAMCKKSRGESVARVYESLQSDRGRESFVKRGFLLVSGKKP